MGAGPLQPGDRDSFGGTWQQPCNTRTEAVKNMEPGFSQWHMMGEEDAIGMN